MRVDGAQDEPLDPVRRWFQVLIRMAKSRAELMEDEIARLATEDDDLARDWRRIPYLSAFVVLAAPAYFVWGPLAAIAAVLCTPALLGTAAYLIGVRRREARELRAELEAELAALSGG